MCMCICELGSEAKCIAHSEQQFKKFENANLEKEFSYLESSVRKHQLALASGSHSFDSFRL